MAKPDILKIHIGCSRAAFNVIEEDHERFNPGNIPLKMDPFLNQLLLFCYDDEYVQRLLAFIMDRKEAEENAKKTGRRMRKEETNQTFPGSAAGGEKVYRSFNLREDIRTALHLEEGSDSRILSAFGTAGNYINTVFEIYGSLPYLFRENIILSSTLHSLQFCIDMKGMVRAQTVTVDDDFRPKFINHTFLPYAIRSDSMGMYHYIVGMDIGGATSKNKMKPVSYRIADLQNVRIMPAAEWSLDYFDENRLEEEIAATGAQFVGGKKITAEVAMNAQGLALYQKKLFNRPRIENAQEKVHPYAFNPDYTVYECYGTREQIRGYFNYTFGEGAIVLSPESLRNEILREMKLAAKTYLDTRLQG